MDANFWNMIDKIIKEIDEMSIPKSNDLEEFYKELKEELKK